MGVTATTVPTDITDADATVALAQAAMDAHEAGVPLLETLSAHPRVRAAGLQEELARIVEAAGTGLAAWLTDRALQAETGDEGGSP